MKKLLLVSLCFLMLSITQVFAQNRTVTGTVTAKEDGLPIPGVTVKVHGTNQGTNTNSNGEYSISVPAGASLDFSFIGDVTQSVPVKAGVTKLSIVLESTSKQLGEVVVTGALGIKAQERSLGYATAIIGTKDLNQAAVTDVSTGLEGKVSGLQVNLTSNGIDPSTRIVLQGNRSITGNNEALLVVDGVRIDDVNYITSLNPNDIATVNILKGGLAAAIYGSKAANGVLVITTKKGSKGRPSITVSNTTEIQSVSYLPALQTSFGGYGGEGGSFVNADGTVNPVPYENESYGPAFNGEKILMALSPIFAADGVTVTGYDSLYTKYSNLKNNRRDFFVKGITNQFNVSYDIGDENSSLHVGFQDVDAGGVIPDDHDRKDNLRIGGTQTYGKFSVEYNAAYHQDSENTYGSSYDQTSGGFSGNPFYFELLNTPADIPLTKTTLQSTTGNVVYNPADLNGQYSNINSYYNAYATNPYWTLQNSRQYTTTYTFSGNVNLAYKPTDWLTISDRLGLTQETLQYTFNRAGVTFAPWAIADPEHAGNVPSSIVSAFPVTFDETFMEQLINNDFIAAFDKKINSDFSISGLVGANISQSYQRELNLQGNELQFPGDYNISSTLGIPGYGENNFRQRDDAIYEEVTLAYKNWLFLHGTNRDEWNSVLAQDHNHYEYPSGDISFVFTDAISALKDNSILSYGKLTGGVAEVANINLGAGSNPYGAYSLLNVFNVSSGFPFGSLGGYSQSTLSLNPNIQPEKTTDYEGGIELSFLKDRLHFTTNYSHSESKNQSLTASVSSATGFTNELTNAGLVTNNTLEFDLNTIAVKTRNFQWTIGLNYTHYGNKVVSLGGPPELEIGGAGAGGIYAVVGKPYPILEEEDFVRDPAGKVIVNSLTGLPSVSSSLTDYGTTNPTKILGVNSSLSYKAFSFSFVIDYRGGNQIYNSTEGTEAFTGISAQSAQNGRARFIFPNSVISNGSGGYVNNTSVAVDNGNGGQGGSFWAGIYGSNIGSIYVDDAAFIKLREANLTYQLPANILTSVPFIKKASLSLIGRNLLMIRPKSNDSIDPEFSDAGTGNAIGSTSVNQTPPTRFYGATLSVTF